MLGAYETQGFEMLLKAFNDQGYLEQLTGLDKLYAEGDAALEPAALHSLPLGPFVPTEVYARGCTAVLPFVWAMVTTHPPSPRAPQQRVYIRPEQIDVVTGILSLFTDDAESWLGESHMDYWLQVHPGAS